MGCRGQGAMMQEPSGGGGEVRGEPKKRGENRGSSRRDFALCEARVEVEDVGRVNDPWTAATCVSTGTPS